jgi:hypothetical protein
MRKQKHPPADFNNPISACFAVIYDTLFGNGTNECAEAILTIAAPYIPRSRARLHAPRLLLLHGVEHDPEAEEHSLSVDLLKPVEVRYVDLADGFVTFGLWLGLIR